MSNKKRINERMVMLQKRSARIEQKRRDMISKVLTRLGKQAVESTKAFLRLQDAIIHALPNNVDEFRGVFEAGSELIIMGDGSKKPIFVDGFNYKRPLVNLNERPGEIKNKHDSYLEVMGLIPEMPNVIFDETTELDQRRLAKVMSITGNLHKVSSSIMDAMILYNKSPR